MHEMNHITMVLNANFARKLLGALKLSNALAEHRLESIFSNHSVISRMLHTAPFIVASAERGFSKLKLFTNYLRSTMDQDPCITWIGSVLCLTLQIIDFYIVVRRFAKKKTFKATQF